MRGSKAPGKAAVNAPAARKLRSPATELGAASQERDRAYRARPAAPRRRCKN